MKNKFNETEQIIKLNFYLRLQNTKILPYVQRDFSLN